MATLSLHSPPSISSSLHHNATATTTTTATTTRLTLRSPSPNLRTRSHKPLSIKSQSSPPTLTQDDLKKLAADKAVEYVRSGMVLGLGTGSTAAFVVSKLGQLLSSGQLTDIVGVPTSKRTQEQAASLGIPLSVLDDHPKLDLRHRRRRRGRPESRPRQGSAAALSSARRWSRLPRISSWWWWMTQN
ncbi:hypothetical protein HYC85_009293 [Camellia sinensis]|uniref:Ribose-5-phosphate isomerase n=1 Tax=Camellia sinensis TaxID=4442 RepID=A0A7J7HF78_CAMSI|nr:hypothetical protein HYC85_009293 [Camellia sinensis]